MNDFDQRDVLGVLTFYVVANVFTLIMITPSTAHGSKPEDKFNVWVFLLLNFFYLLPVMFVILRYYNVIS